MQAVILRDVRTRFFNHGLGFLLVPLWPLAHMFVLLMIYTFMGGRLPSEIAYESSSQRVCCPA